VARNRSYVAQRVAALVPVQGLSSLFSNMYCLFDPSSTLVRFSVQNSGGWLVDHVHEMHGESVLICSTYVDVPYCYRSSIVVCLSVCRSVTLVSPAKTAPPIEMPFGFRTRVGPGNHVLDGVQIPHGQG